MRATTGRSNAVRLAVLLVAATVAASPPRAAASEPATLADVEARVAREYGAPQLEPALLAAALAREPGGRAPYVLFDVRTPAEYEASHLAGAVRVEPDTSAEAFAAAHGAATRGKTAVFYCSVGVRSSILAQRVRAALEAAGATGVANLRGGLFRWHDERRPVVDARGAPTDALHPYDARWGRLITRREGVLPTP